MRNCPKDIAFFSPAASGKDFLADYMVKKYGYTRYAFADNVKSVAKTWFPELFGDGKEKPRWLLQKIGTMFRDIDEDVWIKALFNNIDKVANLRKRYGEIKEYIVITDCRMPNEYQALKERGFIFVRIDVDEKVRQQRMKDRGDKFSSEDMKHHTESFYDTFDCDYTIQNNGKAEDAYKQLDNIMNGHK